jgi:hypothetical protein
MLRTTRLFVRVCDGGLEIGAFKCAHPFYANFCPRVYIPLGAAITLAAVHLGPCSCNRIMGIAMHSLNMLGLKL